MSGETPATLLDDAGIIGGSPMDRIIGMLLERTEALRELHEAMRKEFRDEIGVRSEIKNMITRISERQELHEKSDREAFTAVTLDNQRVIAKLEQLQVSLASTTTATLVQKTKINAWWQAIVVGGAVIMGCFTIFSIFFNHGH